MVMENDAGQLAEILGDMTLCTREEALHLLQQSRGNMDTAAAIWLSIHSQAAPKK